MNQGKLKQINGISHASKFLEKAKVAERQAKAAKHELAKLNVPVKIKTEYYDTLCPGSGIVLWADFDNSRIGADSLGERGKRAEIVGKEAGKRLIAEIGYGAPVDQYLADNLTPFLALVDGKIKISKITNHTKTNIYVVERFLDVKFKIEDKIIHTT